MTQASPTNLYYAQAMYALTALRREFSIKKYKDSEEIAELIMKALTKFEESLGQPIAKYESIEYGEVPNSAKMNRFWNGLQIDINMLQGQLDLLRAASVDTFNRVEMDVKKAQNQNLKSQNKLKTLELYAGAQNQSMIHLGDTFINEDLIDWGSVGTNQGRLQIVGKQMVALPIQEQSSAFVSSSKLSILSGSNGIPGNNQEILDPSIYNSEDRYTFKGETYQPNRINSIIDGEPGAWFEFEKYLINFDGQDFHSNFNFQYEIVDDDNWQYLKGLSENDKLFNWADGFEEGEPLALTLQIQLPTPHNANVITILPFGLEDNKNNPIKIKKVTTSLDKTNWNTLYPQNVWVTSGIDRKITDIESDHITIGNATWALDGDIIQYIRFEIEQHKPIQSYIGHHYYVDEEGKVVPGPHPPVHSPGLYRDPKRVNSDNVLQKMQYFNGKRWAIGIRDIDIMVNNYRQSGILVSQKFEIPGSIDRVALDVDFEVPFDWDQNLEWVKFYISPNDGLDWFRIARIQDHLMDIPEILAFNDPTPVALREPGVGYHDVEGSVNSVRLKIEMERPSNKPYSTAIVRPYTIKIKKRV